jgi:membrane-bound lytic murein transglycosylase MltF
MRILKAAVIMLVVASMFAPGARAEYAVLRSGMRIHISGYENLGRILRLHVPGGSVDVAIEDVINIEPEEVFATVTVLAVKPASIERYPELINAAAKKYGLDAQLLAAVAAAESNFDPRAVSRKNAQGVMQLLPETSARLAVRNPFDPAQSIDAGARYLKELLDRFHDNVKLALAAYNAGPERVEQYGGIPPYRETRDYVARITQRLAQKSIKEPNPLTGEGQR